MAYALFLSHVQPCQRRPTGPQTTVKSGTSHCTTQPNNTYSCWIRAIQ